MSGWNLANLVLESDRQVTTAEQPQPATRRNRRVQPLPLSADSGDSPEDHLRARHLLRPNPPRRANPHLRPARPLSSPAPVSRDDPGDADLSPRLPPPQPRRKEKGLGRPAKNHGRTAEPVRCRLTRMFVSWAIFLYLSPRNRTLGLRNL